ncbi:MAG: hypothetical protein OXC56_01045 [Chloroflexi bacterium]|nr:hypothetical protein [Chloroflexota bacterium]
MAPGRQHRGTPRGSRRREKHGWLRIDRYQAIHEGALERHAFVVADDTTFTRLRDDGIVSYLLEGLIHCAGGIEIDVTKLLAVRVSRRLEQVRGLSYRYNAHVRGGYNILRYDNGHIATPDEFHRHAFDPLTGIERSRTTFDRDRMPTLIEMVSEVEQLARDAGLLGSD